MTTERSLYPRMAAALLALLGLLDAAYLSISRIYPSALVCPTGGGCETVAQSPYSLFPPGAGIPVANAGVFGYLVLFGLAMAALQTDRLGPLPLPLTLLAVSAVGVLFSLYLTSLQLFVIKIPETGAPALCFWCMTSALIQAAIFVALLIDAHAWRGASARTGGRALPGPTPRAR